MKILTVDDSKTMRMLVRDALEAAGFAPGDIVETADGLEALQKLHDLNFQVDLILADWNMPRLTGIDLLRRMRQVVPLSRIPVIMVTSQAQMGQVREALFLGARDYVVKPFEAETIAKKVKKILGTPKDAKLDDTSVLINAISTAARKDDKPELFSNLPMEVLRRLYGIASAAPFTPGQSLLASGKRVDALFVILEGEVELRDNPEDPKGEVRRTGECLGEISFFTERPFWGVAIAKTAGRLAMVPKLPLTDLLLSYPQLSQNVTRVVASYTSRRHASVAKQLPGGLAGKLEIVQITELIQILHQSHKTGQLKLGSGSSSGEILFREGEILSASLGVLRGEPAFYSLIGWEAGTFSFAPGDVPAEGDIKRPTMLLLLEGMRLKDETRARTAP